MDLEDLKRSEKLREQKDLARRAESGLLGAAAFEDDGERDQVGVAAD